MLGGPAFLPGHSSEGVTTWSVSSRYRFTDDVMVYGKVATGYRPGGPNAVVPGAVPTVDSDTLTSYEGGLKSTLLGGRALFNVSVFDIQWKNIQLGVTNGTCNCTFLANGGDAYSRGFELEGSFRPVDGLRLGYNAAYTKARLTSLTTGAPPFFTGATAATLGVNVTASTLQAGSGATPESNDYATAIAALRDGVVDRSYQTIVGTVGSDASAAASQRDLSTTLVADVQAHVNDTPHPLARLHTEGTLPPEGLYDQSVEAEKELDLMRNAALAWRATSDDRYLKLVDRFLAAWVATYQPSFNPIDETRFEGLILAYDMTASALPVKTRNAAAAFIAKLANGYVERVDAQPRPLTGTYRNNWESHRVKLVAMAAFTLDDRKLINAAQRLFVEQIGANVAADGATVDFAERDALHYVTYDLQPLVVAALAARRHNRNWLTQRAQNGASLQSALDWLLPYALGEKTHEEFVHSSVAFDAKRRAAGLPGYSGPWDPKDSAELFHLAARLSGRYAGAALRLSPTPPAWLAVCLPLPAR